MHQDVSSLECDRIRHCIPFAMLLGVGCSAVFFGRLGCTGQRTEVIRHWGLLDDHSIINHRTMIYRCTIASEKALYGH